LLADGAPEVRDPQTAELRGKAHGIVDPS